MTSRAWVLFSVCSLTLLILSPASALLTPPASTISLTWTWDWAHTWWASLITLGVTETKRVVCCSNCGINLRGSGGVLQVELSSYYYVNSWNIFEQSPHPIEYVMRVRPPHRASISSSALWFLFSLCFGAMESLRWELKSKRTRGGQGQCGHGDRGSRGEPLGATRWQDPSKCENHSRAPFMLLGGMKMGQPRVKSQIVMNAVIDGIGFYLGISWTGQRVTL